MQNQAISGNNPEGIFLISFVPAMHHPVPIKKKGDAFFKNSSGSGKMHFFTAIAVILSIQLKFQTADGNSWQVEQLLFKGNVVCLSMNKYRREN
jgi:hypothetical protein